MLERPIVTLNRDEEGRWNVERLLAKDSASNGDGDEVDEAGEATPGAGGDLEIALLRIRDGQLTLRDAAAQRVAADTVPVLDV